MPAAARVDDPITHTEAHSEGVKQMVEGAVTGALIGAALIGIAALAVAGSVVTGGAAAPLLIGAALVAGGMILSMGGKGFLQGTKQGQQQVAAHGQVRTGSGNVTINGRAAAAACLSMAQCDEHSGPQKVAEGSRTVTINGKRASRVGDRTVCDAVIGAGSDTVSIGGPTGACAAISQEVADWETGLAKDAIVAGGVLQFVGMIVGLLPVGGAIAAASGVARVVLLARTAVGLLGGVGFGQVGSHYGGKWFGAGSWEQEGIGTVSALVGGGLIGKATEGLGRVPALPEEGPAGRAPFEEEYPEQARYTAPNTRSPGNLRRIDDPEKNTAAMTKKERLKEKVPINQRDLRWKDVRPGAQTLVNSLGNKPGSWRNIQPGEFHYEDLAQASEWYAKEIAVVQSTKTGQLRMIVGEDRAVPVKGKGSKRILERGEIYAVHTHPEAKPQGMDTLDLDYKEKEKIQDFRPEAVVSWEPKVYHFDIQMNRRIIPPDEVRFDVSPINEDGYIMGYPDKVLQDPLGIPK